jgi:GNAT superfamily N-acetyltransferase
MDLKIRRMKLSAKPCEFDFVRPLRERYRREMACQIVHDSMHERSDWSKRFALHCDDFVAGYGAVLTGGPWAGTNTAFELFVLPEYRGFLLDLTAVFFDLAHVDQVIAQTNDTAMTMALLQYCRQIEPEKLVFTEGASSRLPDKGASLRRTRDLDPCLVFAHREEPVGDWALEKDGEIIATGGYLDHYNQPYVDLYLEVSPDSRRQGFGSFFVQELKRLARSENKIPCGRCAITNVGARKAMTQAGMVSCAHILIGRILPQGPTAQPTPEGDWQ